MSAFAAVRSADGALTIMVVNKQLSTSTTATINLSAFAHRGTAQVWQLTAANAIAHPADIAVGGTSFVAALPPQSVTLFVVPAAAAAGPPSAPTSPNHPVSGLRRPPGQRSADRLRRRPSAAGRAPA